MTSASELANRLGPLRTVREHVSIGGQPAPRLSCGHTVPTAATHIQQHRCRSCLQASRQVEARALTTSSSPLMARLRRALGAQTVGVVE